MSEMDAIERNNKDNLRRFKRWLKDQFKEDWKYKDVFIQDMDVIISAAKELKKEVGKLNE
jgi:NAD(P)H-flavin reductase